MAETAQRGKPRWSRGRSEEKDESDEEELQEEEKNRFVKVVIPQNEKLEKTMVVGGKKTEVVNKAGPKSSKVTAKVMTEITNKSKVTKPGKSKREDTLDEEDEIEVCKILGKKAFGRKPRIYYKIQWKGYASDYDSWESVEYLKCDELIEEFEKEWKVQLSRRRLTDSSILDTKKKHSKTGYEFVIDERDEDLFEHECLMCADGFTVAPRTKKWTLATKIGLTPGHSLTVFEGLTLFYEHFMDRDPLATLGPIRSVRKEDRMICNACASSLKIFCNGLKLLIQASHKDSIISEIADNLEDEKLHLSTYFKKNANIASQDKNTK